LIVSCCIVETESYILHLGACPNVKKSRRSRAIMMTTTEALKLQLDIIQKEKQELEVRNLDISSRVTLKEVEKEREHWKDQYESDSRE